MKREAVHRHRLETIGQPFVLLPTQLLLFLQLTAPRAGEHSPKQNRILAHRQGGSFQSPNQVTSLLC